MSKSAFAELLEEARHRLHQEARRPVPLHFTWDGTSGPESWSAWWDGAVLPTRLPRTYFGCAGEQALRNMVEALRASTT